MRELDGLEYLLYRCLRPFSEDLPAITNDFLFHLLWKSFVAGKISSRPTCQNIGYDRWLDPFFSFQPTFGRNLFLAYKRLAVWISWVLNQRASVCDKGKEGRTLTRDSNSEFTCASLKTSNIPFAWFLVLGCNRQAERIVWSCRWCVSETLKCEISLINGFKHKREKYVSANVWLTIWFQEF